MIELDLIVKEISKSTGIDILTVDTICKHVYRCTVESMKDKDNNLDILFNELFKFKLKTRFKNNKDKKYSAK